MTAGAVVATLLVAHRERVTTRFVIMGALGLGISAAYNAPITRGRFGIFRM